MPSGRRSPHSEIHALGVFVTAELREALRQCATASDVQLLMCGVQEIDVDDWQASAEYSGGFDASDVESRSVVLGCSAAHDQRGAH